jgi:alpha-glucosidase
LPWRAKDKNFGFSTGTPWLPITDHYKKHSMDLEEDDGNSFLKLYRTSLALRKRHPGLGGEADITWHDAPDGIIYFSRSNKLVVLANTTDTAIDVNIHAAAIILHQSQEGASINGSIVTIPANTTLWLQQ